MPRFYFHVRDGEHYPDQDGTELPSLDAARAHAIEVAGQLLKGHKSQIWDGERWRVQVADDVGRELFTLQFIANEPPSSS